MFQLIQSVNLFGITGLTSQRQYVLFLFTSAIGKPFILQPLLILFIFFFFFVISGFFAKSSYRQPVRIFIINKLLTLALPLFLWAFISTVIQFLDSSFYITDLTPVFENPASIQPNYWFFSCLLSISITFYFLLKLLKKPWIILCGALVLNLLFGEWSLVPEEFNPFLLLAKLPVLSTISNWFSFHGIAVYLFWYALGATISP